MKIKQLITILGIGTAVLTAGCSSTMTKSDIVKQEKEIQQIRMEQEDAKEKHQQEKLQQEFNSIPDWVTNPPRADESGFYGVGIGEDEDFLTAMRKAGLQAKYDVASTLKSELSGEDTMTGSGSGEYRYIVNNFVNKINITGTEIVEQVAKPIHGKYRVYTLIKLPYDKFNMILKYQSKPEDTKTLEESYQRLLARTQEKKNEKQ